jgi:hypothetical protein
MSEPAPPARSLGHAAQRPLLALTALALLAGAAHAAGDGGDWQQPARAAQLAAGVLGLLGAAIPGLPARVRALGSVGVAAAGLALLLELHGFASFPRVDWLRPWGIDRWAWLPMASVLLAAGTVPLIRARAAWPRTLAAGLCLVGFALAVFFTQGTRHFEHDALEPISSARHPSPVVLHGQLEQAFWTRQVYDGTPLRSVPQILASERAIACLAHGMHRERELRGGADPATTNPWRSRVRGALWGVQHPATRAAVVLQLSTLLLLPLLAGLCLLGPRTPTWIERGLWAWALLPSAGVALLNLGFQLMLLLGGLPDGAGSRWPLLLLDLGLLLVATQAASAGWAIGRAPRRRSP